MLAELCGELFCLCQHSATLVRYNGCQNIDDLSLHNGLRSSFADTWTLTTCDIQVIINGLFTKLSIIGSASLVLVSTDYSILAACSDDLLRLISWRK